jgi:hypothetical protein
MSREKRRGPSTDGWIITDEALVRAIHEKYGLTDKGFLPESCLDKLPAHYDAWEEVVAEMSELNIAGKLRSRIDAMPVLDCSKLTTEAQWRRAVVILGQFLHSYVNGSNVPWEKLGGPAPEPGAKPAVPAPLAVPIVEACAHFDIPVVIITVGVDNWNFQLIDPALPFALSNITTITSCTGTAAETHFHMLPCSMQAAAGRVIPQLLMAPRLMAEGRDAELAHVRTRKRLQHVTSTRYFNTAVSAATAHARHSTPLDHSAQLLACLTARRRRVIASQHLSASVVTCYCVACQRHLPPAADHPHPHPHSRPRGARCWTGWPACSVPSSSSSPR